MRPVCKLSGTDGNVFALAGKVSSALKKSGQPEKAKEFTEKVFRAHSYHEAIDIMSEYVEIR